MFTIHNNKFNDATGLNGNANGTSRGPNEFHFVWTNWFNSIFPDDPLKTALHEFTHCVQLNILIDKAKETIITQDRLTFDKEFEKNSQPNIRAGFGNRLVFLKLKKLIR